ncbi:MAG: ferredoxin [Caldithrix sp. RBG_13_44_9]|nr:MAG: ferredoxin [Caldithrix sp. RBG_13_44_9]
MSLYQKHVFICENVRDDSDTRGSCSQKGSPDFRNKLKEEVDRLGLKSKIRINKAGCLGTCNQGISMVIYPEGIWYGKVTEADLPEIIEKSLLNNEKIDRLLMPFMRKKV